jgi:type II secretory pathway pseudopilin PulG
VFSALGQRDAERKHPSARRGFMMVEMMLATLLVGVLMALAVESVAWTVRARRSVDQRAAAQEEAANQLDQLTSLAWSDLTAERLSSSQLSPEAQAILPESTLDVALYESAANEKPSAKRITVSIGWMDDNGLRGPPARLTAWIYRRAGE